MNDVSLDMALGLMSRVRARLGFVLVDRHLNDLNKRQIQKALSYLDDVADYIGKAKAERRACEKDEEGPVVERPAEKEKQGEDYPFTGG
jgi:hypothetical protein